MRIAVIASLLCASVISIPPAGVVGGASIPVPSLVPAAAGVQLVPVVIGLTNPVYVGNAHDGTNRLFIVELGGVIKVLQPGSSTPTVFLDIASKVLSGGEQGLLGLAFHPEFATNGRFFVDYTRKPDGATIVAEYQVSAGNPNVADAAEIVLITVAQPFTNHNAGMIEFGQDGFLYIALGDGGSGNDPGNRAQNINDLLGKILRIDIDQPNGPAPYSSPSSNPFFGAIPGRDEIFALGLRNPFRFSFDRGTGALFAGDVGQGAFEEIDIITNGGNYGWRVFEGFHCTGNDPGLCSAGGFTAPIAEYGHSLGRCSITGGYVYRGLLSTLPVGAYVYGDFCTGEIFLLESGVQSLLVDSTLNISSFGEDESGEIYVVNLGGQVYRIVGSASAPNCSFSILPASQSFSVNEGGGTISVAAPAGCTWSANSNVSWVTVTSGASGIGNGSVGYSVAQNKNGTGPRAGTITIAGQTFTITQAGPKPSCISSLAPASQGFGSGGGSGSFSVSATAGCSWSAVSLAFWITVTSTSAKPGSTVVTFSVGANPNAAIRQGSIAVQDRLFMITQAAAGCSFTLNASSASFGSSGGPGTVGVSAAAGCAWSAVSNDSWISISSGASGSGNGTVSYSVSANPNTNPRTGTMTIAGKTFTVTQAGIPPPCIFSLMPASASFGSSGGGGSISVTAPAGCGWTAVSNDSWISISSGASGSGDGAVNYSVSANPNASPRTGTMTIAGISFSVSQAAQPPCSFSIVPAGSSFGSIGGTGNVSVNAPGGCGWTAISNDSWMTITSGATGSGNGLVTYSVSANPGASLRTGTLIIAGQTFTVTQAAAGSCVISLSPTNKSFVSKGGTGSIGVTANSGCSWTAVSNVSWLTISSGAKGTGNGAVNYTVGNNATGQPRTGTITIGGLRFTAQQQ